MGRQQIYVLLGTRRRRSAHHDAVWRGEKRRDEAQRSRSPCDLGYGFANFEACEAIAMKRSSENAASMVLNLEHSFQTTFPHTFLSIAFHPSKQHKTVRQNFQTTSKHNHCHSDWKISNPPFPRKRYQNYSTNRMMPSSRQTKGRLKT